MTRATLTVLLIAITSLVACSDPPPTITTFGTSNKYANRLVSEKS